MGENPLPIMCVGWPLISSWPFEPTAAAAAAARPMPARVKRMSHVDTTVRGPAFSETKTLS